MFLTACSPRSSNSKRQLVADVVAHAARDADAAGLRQRLQPRRDVDAVAEDVAVLDHHVADIDADAERHALVVGQRLVGAASSSWMSHRRTARHRTRWRTRPARCRRPCRRCGRDAARSGSSMMVRCADKRRQRCRPRRAPSGGCSRPTSAARIATSLRSRVGASMVAAPVMPGRQAARKTAQARQYIRDLGTGASEGNAQPRRWFPSTADRTRRPGCPRRSRGIESRPATVTAAGACGSTRAVRG